MKYIKYTISLLTLILFVPGAMTNSFAQIELEKVSEIEYTIDELRHSFGVMEQYVIYDVKKNITFNISSALKDHHVLQKDIEIALEYAIINNDLMNVRDADQVNELETDQEARKRIIKELEEGKFRALFDEITPTVNEITYVTLTQPYRPIISAFGISEVPITEIFLHDDYVNSLRACDGGYGRPHPEDLSPFTSTRVFQSSDHIREVLVRNFLYHAVRDYASFNPERDIDYARVVQFDAPGGCNNGEFRNQATIYESELLYKVTENEPNPEILHYDWPSYWWGGYVIEWHLGY